MERRSAAYEANINQPRNRLRKIVHSALTRSRRYKLAFDAVLVDVLSVFPPSKCPACGVTLNYTVNATTHRNPAIPSIDRVDNALGYTVENTRIICFRCNRIKSDASLADLKSLVAYMEENGVV